MNDSANINASGPITAATGQDDSSPASGGTGPLLKRDYWALLDHCPLSSIEVMAHVKAHFCELPPEALVTFEAREGVALGAQLDIVIMPAQRCGVRVIHEDAQSLTLGTLKGHPEAGRITFGAYRNPASDVIFHIRSRARSSSIFTRAGFVAIGEAMQTNTWTDFISRTAGSVGAQVRDAIHADTQEVDELPEDGEACDSPTFVAAGG